ncbi:CPBP family intramembrane metalloprotease [Simiduia sp. 21SJ11W-1]|uniref:CPBP family intramembrane glutamic endopeptidase n=1 Tax=Simiduia sp. 21SJ11W-1 TaxID=2909669 RepID=UPI0020A1B953|nr:type II CAAX endopeptidase family protein [Simiduia sp. 21SJ11W-1]UTA47636.1 CPBP family intramembrane metalloprotease [Simiduia sp. 21SJ11W-1]
MLYVFSALFLGAAVLHIATRKLGHWQWLPIFVPVVCSALATHANIASIASYLSLGAAVFITLQTQGRWRALLTWLCVALGLAIAVRALPTFSAIGPVANQELSVLSGAWAIYIGINKSLVGLLLLPLVPAGQFSTPFGARPWPASVWLALILGPPALGLTAWLLGAQWDVKFSAFALLFALANLSFVILCEEIFFRGVIQQQLFAQLSRRFSSPASIQLALVTSAVIFGALHFAGGLFYVGLATIAALLYGWLYWRAASLWAAMGAHLGVNLVHFIFLQYPLPA